MPEFLKQSRTIIKDYPSSPPGTLPSPGGLYPNPTWSWRGTERSYRIWEGVEEMNKPLDLSGQQIYLRNKVFR
jgi:hypothetical protein